jgi:hypothetical protein
MTLTYKAQKLNKASKQISHFRPYYAGFPPFLCNYYCQIKKSQNRPKMIRRHKILCEPSLDPRISGKKKHTKSTSLEHIHITIYY